MCKKCKENHRAGIYYQCPCECHKVNYGKAGKTYSETKSTEDKR